MTEFAYLQEFARIALKALFSEHIIDSDHQSCGYTSYPLVIIDKAFKFVCYMKKSTSLHPSVIFL